MSRMTSLLLPSLQIDAALGTCGLVKGFLRQTLTQGQH